MGDVLERWRAMREQADRGRVVGSSIPCELGDELAAELEKHHERYVTESLDVVKELQSELQSCRALLSESLTALTIMRLGASEHDKRAIGLIQEKIRKALADSGEG